MSTDSLLDLKENIQPYYYMFWKMLFALPVWLRRIAEIVLICGLLFLVYWVGKHLLVIVCRLLQGVVYIGIRIFREIILACYLKIVPTCDMERLTFWDDRSAEFGRNCTEWLKAAIGKIREKKAKGRKTQKWKKAIFKGGIFLYVWILLPGLPLIKNIDETYRAPFYFMDNTFQKIEAAFTPEIGKYPDVFLKVQKEEAVEKIEKKNIFLKLNAKGRGGSHIRETPSLDGKSLEIVTEKDAILYREQWVDDVERYWLLVSTDDVEEGWISGNLIDEKQMEELGLGR